MISRTANVEGVQMRWEERGEGAPVVLGHGIPTSPALWRDVAPRIEGTRCLAWEMIGYGGSIPQGRDRDISVGRQADYLAVWLRHLGIEKAVLVGHDLGGGVVQIAAVRNPGLCAGLFLTNAIGYDSWPITSVKLLRAFGPAVRHLPRVALKQILRTLMIRGHDSLPLARAALDAHWPAYDRADGPTAFIHQVNALDQKDTLAVAGDLPKLRVPARVVWGVADQFQKIRYGERFARDLDAPLRRIEGGKHFTPEDHGDIIAEEINALCRDTFPTAAR